MKIYGPLAEYLTTLIGEKVTYRHPRDWLRYQRDIRRDVFDIVFDGPHFASWRILHYSHSPLVKLPGHLDFYFITHKENNKINKPKDMELKKVCAIPPPNLTSLVLLNVLNSPVREPLIKSVKGGMGAVIKQLDKRHCDAAVVRKDFFDKKLPDEMREKFKIVYTSKPIPNQVITGSSRVNKMARAKIIKSLTEEESEGTQSAQKILMRFGGKKVRSFEVAQVSDFEGQNNLLEGVILGW